ncbi:restriction endonuclease type II-like protein [Podospora aff. communis PSN243]|uniref:Restriction endonuclease type II-like protein n=1 Tax=Podospora aff. communis PSN243 TaxID=3040156 RepID=A0AAV9GY78_9PEZI|nr:restriction endonuclease type II-like protein [Podospora aff. communis PSN243]
MEDEYGVDDDFLAALTAADARPSRSTGPRQPIPQKIQQPTPQRLDRAPPANAANASASKIVQPTPQALPSRSSGSSILVSPRQKGNPVLTCLKSVPWEYSDIPADYGLGLTTCALFLSLKYHRLHPEYIYTRIRNLQGKYNLRILLTMVDIPNHEDSLRELSKTSLVNNVTVILCWSAAEAARYLELYKSYEHAGFAAIQGHQATGYAEKLVEFVTVPRAVNKADAVALVGTFGSLRSAVNAEPEQVATVGGWGERKVKAWCRAVEEPFRVKKAARRKGVGRGGEGAVPVGTGNVRVGGSGKEKGKERDVPLEEDEELEALFAAEAASSSRQNVSNPATAAFGQRGAAQSGGRPSVSTPSRDSAQGTSRTPATESRGDEQLSDGIAAALARLREKG